MTVVSLTTTSTSWRHRTGSALAVLGGTVFVVELPTLLGGHASGSQVAYAVAGGAAALAGARWLPAQALLGGFSALVYLVLYAPIAIVVVYAFNSGAHVAVWEGASTRWFDEALHDTVIRDAVGRSLVIAVCSAVLATLLATPAALALCRARGRVRRIAESWVLLSIAVPELVIGVSVLIFFVNASIPLGLTSVLLGHTVFNLGFVVLLVRARFLDMDDELEEAAQDLGATTVGTFVQVTLPAIAPGVVAGFLLAFTFSFDNVVVSSFTTGAGDTTWPLYVLSSLRFGLTPELNAAATLMMLVTFVCLGACGLALRGSTRRRLT